MTVRFYAVDEFLDELERDAAEAERGIVRLTNIYASSATLPFRHLSVVATYAVRGVVVRLERYVGDLVGTRTHDDPVVDRATGIQRTIEAKVRDLGLEIRAGTLEDRPAEASRMTEAVR
jgi:hypothetical protein